MFYRDKQIATTKINKDFMRRASEWPVGAVIREKHFYSMLLDLLATELRWVPCQNFVAKTLTLSI